MTPRFLVLQIDWLTSSLTKVENTGGEVSGEVRYITARGSSSISFQGFSSAWALE